MMPPGYTMHTLRHLRATRAIWVGDSFTDKQRSGVS
jgi:hypothetical protein